MALPIVNEENNLGKYNPNTSNEDEEKLELEPISEEERAKHIDTNKIELNTAQRIEAKVAVIARNLDALMLLLYGIAAGIFSYLLGRSDWLMIIFLMIILIFLYFFSLVVGKGDLTKKLINLAENSVTKEILNTITGKQTKK